MLLLSMIALALGHGTHVVGGEDCDDAYPGEVGLPWCTLAPANEELQPGDVLQIQPGTYAGTLAPERTGLEDLPIIVQGVGGGEVVLTADTALVLDGLSWYLVEGLTFEGAEPISVEESSHIALRDLEVRGAEVGIRADGAADLRLSDSRFFEVEMALSAGGAAALTVDGCDVAGGSGLSFSGSDGLFRRNRFHAASPGLSLGEASSAQVLHNAFVRCDEGALVVGVGVAAVVRNNAFVDNVFEGAPAHMHLAELDGLTLQANLLDADAVVLGGEPAQLSDLAKRRPAAVLEQVFGHPGWDEATLEPSVGSLLVDGGAWLAEVVAAKGARLTLDDSGAFWAGRGALGVGDAVRLSTDTDLRTLVDEDEAEVVVLDTETEAPTGAGIALAFSGAAPDIGPVELGLELEDTGQQPGDTAVPQDTGTPAGMPGPPRRCSCGHAPSVPLWGLLLSATCLRRRARRRG